MLWHARMRHARLLPGLSGPALKDLWERVYHHLAYVRNGNGQAIQSPYSKSVGKRHIVEWHFTGIELYKTPAQMLFDQDIVGLLPLVPFCQGGGTLPTIEREEPPDRDGWVRLAMGFEEKQNARDYVLSFAVAAFPRRE